MRLKTLAAASALLLTASLSAQLSTSVTGEVQVAPAGACAPFATHALECSTLLLQSSTIDLSQFEGANRKLTGNLTFNGPGCPIMEVTMVETAGGSTSTFSLSNYRIGSNVLMTTFAPLGNTLATFLAFDPGFIPLGNFGTLLISPLSASLYSIDLSIGINIKSIPIPNDPNLIGCSPVFQVLSVNLLSPLDSELYNPACFTIR